jgi:predicted ATPase
MHIRKVTLLAETYPTKDYYPFNLPVFQETRSLSFDTPVTFFTGENGSGKSTLLKAISNRCGIHIWQALEGKRYDFNPYEELLYRFIEVEWTDGYVKGSFFSSDIFRDFARNLDEWATADPEMLKYFGGKSLMTQSHGQSLMSFFKARYKIKGLYLLDEPETALSPKSQLALLELLKETGKAGHAQFLVATHSPILMSCPDTLIYSFDTSPVSSIAYRETDHYKIYRQFFRELDEEAKQRT